MDGPKNDIVDLAFKAFLRIALKSEHPFDIAADFFAELRNDPGWTKEEFTRFEVLVREYLARKEQK